MSAPEPQLKRTLNVWQAVGLSTALMAPSMAANINPQATVPSVGRAVPLAFLLAAVGVLLVTYVFVRLCQHFHHSGSVYAFVGATLGARSGVVAGWGLLGTYVFYGVTTSSVVGIFGTSFLNTAGIWTNPPTWAPFMLAAFVLVLSWTLTITPARRGTNILLTSEGTTVTLILVVCAIVLVRLLSHHTPSGQHFTLSVFEVSPGTGTSALFLGVVFGFLSFAGFEAASTLGEETANPNRDIPRAILGTALFGGVWYVLVTAVEMMGFGANSAGVTAFGNSSSLIGDLGRTYAASWVGNLITLGSTVSAFGCCLACSVGGARLLFALTRDGFGERGPGRATSPRVLGNALRRAVGLRPRTDADGEGAATPAIAGTLVVGAMGAILVVCVAAFNAHAENTFVWGGSIGTLILLVAYMLTTLGAISLLFIRRLMPVPTWQLVIPLAALLLLGYTLYRNVIPYPTSGAARWFPIVSGGWLMVAVIGVVAAPEFAHRLGRRLAEAEGISPETASPEASPLLESG